MIKEMKQGRSYFIINNDEPYIEKLYEVFKKGKGGKVEQPQGDISFQELKKQEGTKKLT